MLRAGRDQGEQPVQPDSLEAAIGEARAPGGQNWCFHSQGPGDDGGAGHLTLVLNGLIRSLGRDITLFEEHVPGLAEYRRYAGLVAEEEKRLKAQLDHQARRNAAIAAWERENPPPR